MARIKAFNPDKVLQKALDLFWQHGYEATSMQMLVKGTGLSRSSLYDTFGDKRALYKAAVSQYRAQTEIDVVSDPPPSAKQQIVARLQSIVDGATSDEGQRGCFMVNTAVELGPHDAEFCSTANESLTVSESYFYDLLELGKARGEFASSLDSRATARFLLNASCGLQVFVKAQKERDILQDVLDTTVSLLG